MSCIIITIMNALNITLILIIGTIVIGHSAIVLNEFITCNIV